MPLEIHMVIIASLNEGLPLLPLAAWVFGSSGMLLWGLAALLPIVIHLWSRRKYQQVSWAAMEYLLAAVQKHARRIRLERWLLLSLRILILLLLALALSDPRVSWWPSATGNRPGEARRHLVLVIDGSFSMAAEEEDGTRFSVAKRIAEKWIRAARQGDGFTLIMMASPPEVVIRSPAFDVEDALRELDNLVLPHAMANLETTVTELEQLIEEVRKDQPRLQETVVGVFTDMGETTWGAAAEEPLAARLEELARDCRLQVIDVGNDATQNVAITRCELKPGWVTVQQDIPWEAEVRNFSEDPIAGLPVEFWIDGQRVHQERVDLEPGSQLTLHYRARFQVPGEHQIEVRTRGDALAIDNRRWASVPVRQTLEVLCVEGRAGEARYVDLSLNPTGGRQLQIRPEVVSESGLLERDLSRYAAVFLCNVGRFGLEEANVLYEYLRQAGTVVFFLGDRVEAQDYNEALGASRGKRRVLPARLIEPVATARYQFDPRDYEHPIIAPFKGQVDSGLLTSPITRYIQVEPYGSTEQSTPQVVLQFANSDPAIIEERIGRGRSIVFTTAASDQSVDQAQEPPIPWSDLGTWPSFLPLVQETLALAVRTRDQERNVEVGQVLEISQGQAGIVSGVEVINPRGQANHVASDSSGDQLTWWYENTSFSGMYEARYQSAVDQSEWFAVNVDTRESDLSRSDPALLPSLVEVGDTKTEMTDQQSPLAAGRAIYRYLLAGLLGLLLTESLYACYLGRATG